MQGSKTPIEVRRRIAALAAKGWSNADIAAEVQVCRATATRYVAQARAQMKARAMLDEELRGLREIIAGIWRGRCWRCKELLIAFRTQGVGSCPVCQARFDTAGR